MYIFKNLYIIIKILLYITFIIKFFNNGRFIRKLTVITCYGLHATNKDVNFFCGQLFKYFNFLTSIAKLNIVFYYFIYIFLIELFFYVFNYFIFFEMFCSKKVVKTFYNF